jgi:GNAT superfamily N-acetyltransferase
VAQKKNPMVIDPGSLVMHPLTPERWSDLETLFGPRGAVAGCWCMWWRLPRAEFNRLSGEGTRALFKGIVERGKPGQGEPNGDAAPGILAYAGDRPVGWCAVAPREEYPALERSRILKPVDDQPVWSITCFFIDRAYRRQGVMLVLIRAALEFARERGARIVEAYPTEAQNDEVPPVFVFTGLAAAFQKSGFVEVARRSAHRPIMRWSAD